VPSPGGTVGQNPDRGTRRHLGQPSAVVRAEAQSVVLSVICCSWLWSGDQSDPLTALQAVS